MKDEIGRLIKHSGVYGLGALLSKFLGFLMIPVYTHYLAPADYGVLELFDLIFFFAAMFGVMGIHSAIFRFYSAYDSEHDKKEVVSTALICVAAASLLAMLAVRALASPLAGLVLGDVSYSHLIGVVAVTLFFSNLSEVSLAYWRAQQRTVLFVVISLLRTLLSAVLLVVAIVGLKKGVVGVVYANLMANAISGLALFGMVLWEVGAKVSKTKLDQMLRYGIPLIGQSLASFVLVFSDRFFLRRFASLSDVGVYGLGYKLAMAVAFLVTGPFAMTWSWQQFEMAKQDAARDRLAKVQTYQFFLSLFVGLAVSVLAKDLLRIMSEDVYWSAARIVPLIALSYVLSNLRSVLHTGILVQKATHYLAIISGVTALVNLALNFLLISRFHAMGAAVATVLSYALAVALSFGVAQHIYYVRYEYARNAGLLALATVTYLVSTVPDLALLPSVAVNLVLLALFLLISVKLLQEEEWDMFRQLAMSLARQFRGVLARGG